MVIAKNTTIARNKINNVLCDLDHYIQVRGRVHNLKNIDVDLVVAQGLPAKVARSKTRRRAPFLIL
ncbi:MAG: hypothetical protein ACJASB_002636 [Shewanella psychromarinicola]|jgi:hypothetical protein|uniref:Uncharacterized protein n=1 Tax=Shewanella psychromarinicola TaxID=2487742 RepID=A0A3N4E804_9GAMM|nr:hypothetical protein EGC77_01260 [Shewanella psychromarinicola]